MSTGKLFQIDRKSSYFC